MWPKGDGWGGGGHFLSKTRIALNHRDTELKLAEGFSVPKWLKGKTILGHVRVGVKMIRSGLSRLKRDGWKFVEYSDQNEG